MHPLSDIGNKIKGTGYLQDNNAVNTTDEFGNPNLDQIKKPVEIELLLKSKGTSKTSMNQSGIDRIIKTYTCFLLTEGVDINALDTVIDLENNEKLYILDRTQKMLTPINEVFGVRFEGYKIVG